MDKFNRWPGLKDAMIQGYNARKVNCSCVHICVHIETSSLWAKFVNKKRCIRVRDVSEEDESIEF